MSKKILSIFVLVLTLSFTTEAFASLTFTTDAITGTTASSIDLGAGNALSLQTTGNGAINLGSGLLTSTGGATFSGTVKGLNVYEDSNYNRALGSNTLSRIVTGFSNTAVGNTALNSIIGGNYNSAYGASSLEYLTSGSFNVAFGMRAGVKSGASPDFLNALTTGSNNTFIGYQSGFGSVTQRSNSTAIGNGAYVNADNTVVLGNGAVVDVLAGSTALATVKAGAVQLTTKADPTCGVGTRGQFWFLAGGAGVKDTVNVCAKDAGDSYAWRVVY